MLAVSPLRNTTKDENKVGRDIEAMDQTCEFTIDPEEFPEFADHGNLLESIDFDDLFNGINDGDVLPDLEIDPEILTDFSDQMNNSSVTTDKENNNVSVDGRSKEEGDKGVFGKGEEVVSKRDDDDNHHHQEAEVTVPRTVSNGCNNRDSGERKRKYSSGNAKNNNNNNQGKRKAKVDWTPELHRRFVQAVEQLGVDKAVPSRILELMGIDCLTRHNVASHLQKYRSHWKHLLARDAEAASWSQKRQMYGAAGGGKNNGWLAPTIGIPPPATVVQPPMHHHPRFWPLHVWGHPTVDQPPTQHMWPKHLPHSRSPPPAAHPPMWVASSPMDPYWHHRVPNGPPPAAPYFAQPLAALTRFGAPPVPGIPPPPHHAMYKSEPSLGLPAGKPGPPPPADFYPSMESIDAVIGKALTKPWLPLPLGLKPPVIDSVMVELHRHGVSMTPPADEETQKKKKNPKSDDIS